MNADHAAAAAKDETAPKDQRFDGVAMSLHWVTLALLVARIGSVWLLSAAKADQAAPLLAVHRSLGLLIWLVTLYRLGWRQLSAAPAAHVRVSAADREAQ